MQLNKQQLNHFHTFGYICLRALFSPEEVESITAEFETSIRAAGGQDYDGSRRLMFLGPIERTPRLCSLLDDERILGLVGSVIGEDFNYSTNDGNYYTGDTPWHADGGWGQLFAVKVAFYLDPVARDTGALRVIPASHRPEHFVRAEGIDPNQTKELFGLAPRDFPGNVALETHPGDIVMFNHDLFHASFGGSSRRRMFTMNCTRHGHSPEDMRMVRSYIRMHSPGGHKMNAENGMFQPLMLDTAGPGRMEHLRQPAAIHDELFPRQAQGVPTRSSASC